MAAPKKKAAAKSPTHVRKPVATRLSSPKCPDHQPRYQGDYYEDVFDAHGEKFNELRMQRYVCPTCGEEMTQEAPDA